MVVFRLAGSRHASVVPTTLLETICKSLFASTLLSASVALAASPTVTLDSATFTGGYEKGVNFWLGLPFAKPPIDELRFALPVANDPYTVNRTVVTPPNSCYQQPQGKLPVDKAARCPLYATFQQFSLGGTTSSEDCLTVNVYAPSNAKPTSGLPVAVFIFGGGFQTGSNNMYNGTNPVNISQRLKQPIIYVSLNYRVSGFGFLGGSEVKAAGVGNLGLQDQRLALRWVQKYIGSFGGDPKKVTLWGESAGGISIGYQILANKGNNEGLFRAAIMASGTPVSWGPIERGQVPYNQVVAATGCAGAQDTLKCLRTVPYSKLADIFSSFPPITGQASLNLTFPPRIGGGFIDEHPFVSYQAGRFAKVPVVFGDQDDEGTAFTVQLENITQSQEVTQYLKSNYLSATPNDKIEAIYAQYSLTDPAQGSPFDTGIANQVTPVYKGFAAIQGDLFFNGPRRAAQDAISATQNVWVYRFKRFKNFQCVGSFHASGVFNSHSLKIPVVGGLSSVDYKAELASAFSYFVATLNPNYPQLGPNWVPFKSSDRKMLVLRENNLSPVFIDIDDDRLNGTKLLNNLHLQYSL